MTDPTAVFGFITADGQQQYTLYRLPPDEDLDWQDPVQFSAAEYDDYLNVMTRYRLWQARLRKAAQLGDQS